MDSSPETPVTPLTEAQLQWFADAEAHSVKTAVDRVQKRALAAFLILFAGIAGNFYVNSHDANQQRDAIVASGQVVAVDGCNRDFKTGNDFINLFQRLDEANSAALKSGRITQEDRDLAHGFYASEIAKKEAAQPDCRQSRDLLTSDPDKTRDVPTPLHRPDKP